MRLTTILATLVLFVLASCGPVDFAERSETVSRTLTVREIDRDARSFAVTGDGQRFILRVSDAVKNFDQIEVGDKLNVEFVEAVAVGMADPSDTGETIDLEGAVVAGEGQKPAIAGGEFFSTVVEFISYDPATNLVVVQNKDGEVFATQVRRELRRFARSRQPGDLIEVDIATGLAIAISAAE